MTVEQSDIVRATMEGQWNVGPDMQNVFTIRQVSAGVSESTFIDAATTILEELYALLSAALSVLLVVRDIRYINLTQSSDIGLGLFVDDTPGVDAGSTFPPQNAYGLTLTTDRLGVRGRKFFGGVPESMADDDGILTPATILDLADVGDFMTVAQTQAGMTIDFGVVASFDSVFLPFQSYTIPVTVVTQRRRRLGVGS